MLLRMIECIEKKQDHAMTLLDAVRCIAKAWRQVMDRNVCNCFCHIGIRSKSVRMKMPSWVKLPLLLLMMICLYRNGREKLVVNVGHYDYDAYAVIDNDIVRPRHKQTILSEK